MDKKYHFISGLPRSGSTLLSAILNQNPKFHSGITDVLLGIVGDSHRMLSAPFNNNAHIGIDQKINTIKGIFDGYHKHIDREVIFNTNRQWTNLFHIVNHIYPNSKMICCVRDLVAILNSFEKLYKRNVFNSPPYYGIEKLSETDVTIRSRSLYTQFLEQRISMLSELMHGPQSKKILFLDYDDLIENPETHIKKIYNFIEEPYYNHNFDDIGFDYSQYELYDKVANVPNMHLIKNKVQREKLQSHLPPSLIKEFSGKNFWK